MEADDCKIWEYREHQSASTVVETSEEFALQIRKMPTSQNGILRDTRHFHQALFKSVVSAHCWYLAGQYRGSEFECLRHRNVTMGHKIGAPYSAVSQLMEHFHVDLAAIKNGLDAQWRSLTPPQFAVRLVQAVAQVISQFQLIHPYANGNGHVARLMGWVLMANYNLLPAQWWVHENPGWDTLIQQHQDGDVQGLELFILRRLAMRN